jgi:Zn ribbon nucleic-acid-binding protein
MGTIHLADTSQIRDKVYRTIHVGKRCVVEVSSNLDDALLLVVHYRFPNSPWWRVNKWVVEVGERGITFPESMPARIAARVVNKLLGRNEVRVLRTGAGCPQCNVRHGEWVETSVGLQCTLCGWIAGTVPQGHVQVGDRFWVQDQRVIAHPDTMVKVLAAHNQVTALCSPSPELWARLGELPKFPIRLAEVEEAVPDYAYIEVEVVALPEKFDPIP